MVLKFGMEGVPPSQSFHSKNGWFPLRYCQEFIHNIIKGGEYLTGICASMEHTVLSSTWLCSKNKDLTLLAPINTNHSVSPVEVLINSKRNLTQCVCTDYILTVGHSPPLLYHELCITELQICENSGFLVPAYIYIHLSVMLALLWPHDTLSCVHDWISNMAKATALLEYL